MSLAEIAKMTGVSTATVSRALNNSPLVRKETADRIHEAVVQIGYTLPTLHGRGGARRERNGRNASLHRRVAVIAVGQMHQGWMASPVIGNFVSGVTSASREFDVDVMLDDIPHFDAPSRLVERGEIGGAILLINSIASRGPEWIGAIERMAEKLPVVWAMGGHASHMRIDHVLPDNLGIGRLAATYLHDRGCRRVALVTTEPSWPLTRQRLMMFTSTAIDAGLDVRTFVVSDHEQDGRVFAGDVRVVKSIAAVAEALADDGYRPDGLFCPRDLATSRLYPALHKVGLRPQRDLKIVSCDKDEAQLSLMTPTPATIDINPQEVARIALRRLRTRMRNPQEPTVIINVRPALIEPQGYTQSKPAMVTQPIKDEAASQTSEPDAV